MIVPESGAAIKIAAHVSDLWEGTSAVLQKLDPSMSGGVRIDIQHIQRARRAFECQKENIGVVHDVGMVLGLQDPEVPVHIGHDAWAADACIDHLRDDGNPMGVEGRSLNGLTLLLFMEAVCLTVCQGGSCKNSIS